MIALMFPRCLLHPPFAISIFLLSSYECCFPKQPCLFTILFINAMVAVLFSFSCESKPDYPHQLLLVTLKSFWVGSE